MNKDGEVVHGLEISTKKAATAAFAKLRAADRFDTCELVNATKSWQVGLGLFQGLDESGDALPSGYARDTGVTVVGAGGILPGGRSVATVSAQIKVYATRVKCSAQIRLMDGSQDHTVTFPDAVLTPQEIADGTFIGGATFTLTQSRNKPVLKRNIRKDRRYD